MDIRTKFIINIPDTLTEMLNLNEDTLFEVEYSDGKLIIEPIIDDLFETEDLTIDVINGKESYDDGFGECFKEGFEDGYDDGYDEGFEDGVIIGYTRGYDFGYGDAEEGCVYDNTYVGYRDEECDFDCLNCIHYDEESDSCTVRNN